MPTTVAALTGFLTQVPAQGALPRGVAIAAAHHNTGDFLDRTVAGGLIAPTTKSLDATPPAGELIAACPTGGWPEGFLGRRNGFLIVLTRVLGHTRIPTHPAHRAHPRRAKLAGRFPCGTRPT